MGNRLKEDGKSEKLIRSLLKQPGNSKCINCNSRGPQYICTTFWTFVCTTCSGIHREFTHRVKSVSVAKFTPEEISYLKAGGNERAKEIYFKEVDLHRVPDNSNVGRLRDFIKHVYVDRRYSGGKMPSIVKVGSGEEACDSNVNGRRSDVGAGIINNWRREDRFARGKRPAGDPTVGAKKEVNAIRPITDILGEDSISLHVIQPPRTSSDVKTPDASSKSVAYSNGNPSKIKPEASLIDFDAPDCQPPMTASNGATWQLSSMQPSSEVAVQHVQVKSSGRNELPADIFTAMYAPQPVHAPMWHTGLAPGISFSVQYNTAVAMQEFSQSTKTANPFDLGSESSPAQPPEFPPMTSLQNALPRMPCQPQASPSFGNDAYKAQHLSSNLPQRPQGVNVYGYGVTGLSSTNPDLDLAGSMATVAPPNASGNPFG